MRIFLILLSLCILVTSVNPSVSVPMNSLNSIATTVWVPTTSLIMVAAVDSFGQDYPSTDAITSGGSRLACFRVTSDAGCAGAQVDSIAINCSTVVFTPHTYVSAVYSDSVSVNLPGSPQSYNVQNDSIVISSAGVQMFNGAFTSWSGGMSATTNYWVCLLGRRANESPYSGNSDII